MDWPALKTCGGLLYPTVNNGLSSEQACAASLFYNNAASAESSDLDGRKPLVLHCTQKSVRVRQHCA